MLFSKVFDVIEKDHIMIYKACLHGRFIITVNDLTFRMTREAIKIINKNLVTSISNSTR